MSTSFLFVERECSRSIVEGRRVVHRVALHEDPLRTLGNGAAPECTLEVLVLGETT